MKPKYYNKLNHISNLLKNEYYANLIRLRNIIEIGCDSYFQALNAPRVDLFMITKGVSSPSGKGSDSVPIPFALGKENVFLVDSSQFGMEPLIQKSFEMVYCYLPSFRGENPDARHINQFYHCEVELQGDYKKSMMIAENLVKYLVKLMVKAYKENAIDFKKNKFLEIEKILDRDFPIVTFDEADALLKKSDLGNLIERRSYGRVITNEGERKLGELIGKNKYPIWLTHYDRDTVPFYQKPDNSNVNKVLNADLLFPSLDGGYGGEIIGSGQRQDNANEIKESMSRQAVQDISNYEWYIQMRNNDEYKTTSGFGMGIERFIAWSLGLPNIVDTAIYPIIKNEKLIV